jgi:hypothetical protein
MNFTTLCPNCLSDVDGEAALVGKSIICSACGHPFLFAADHQTDWLHFLSIHPLMDDQPAKQHVNLLFGTAKAIIHTDQRLAIECSCGKKLKASLNTQGKTLPCPGCQQTLTIPILPMVQAYIAPND